MSASAKPHRFYRKGRNHRDGRAVGFAEVRRRFDFRSIRLGRWVTPVERDRSATLFYDALCDLMDILNGVEAVVSLRGTLSLEYGIGGRPGVSAHYEPTKRCFALAKNAGPGSIAHEWFHAFDHYIAGKAFAGAPAGLFASKAWLDNKKYRPHPLNDLLMQCYRVILLDETGEYPSELFSASIAKDRELGSFYYSLPEELCARSFEAFIQDAPVKNNFLVSGSKATIEAKYGLYPQGEHRERIRMAFQAYFSSLGNSLKSN